MGGANSRRLTPVFVTVHNYTIGSGTKVDLGREAQGFVDEVASIPGFRAYLVVDAGDGAIASIAVFDTGEGIEECDRRAAEFVEQRLSGYRLSGVEVTEGQVLASQVGPLVAPESAGSPHA